MISRPDGTVVGPFTLAEYAGVGFTGIYVYNFITHHYDLEGEYLASVISPAENVRSIIKWTLDVRPEPYPNKTVFVSTQNTEVNTSPNVSLLDFEALSSTLDFDAVSTQPVTELINNELDL